LLGQGRAIPPPDSVGPVDSYALGDFSVSRIGFGAMQLPGPGVWGPPRDRGEALEVLRRAVELGVDHIDTAQYYGPDVANELIREALHPYPDNLALVSKVGARRDQTGGWLPYNKPDQLRSGIEDNLRSLGVEQLAAVNLRVMGDEPDQRFDDQLTAMIQAREDGLIGGVGLSNVTLERLRHALERTPIVCVQNPLNLADRSSMPVLRECATRAIAFVPFFPLGSAFAQDNQVLGNPEVRAIAERLGATPAQIALAWTLGLASNVLLIPGTSSVAHLEENLAVADVTLDEQAQRQLAAAQG
jgi:pyridoxine 4-dehydrogenase